MSRRRVPMRQIRQVLEYRLSKGISADQTAQALSLSKGSVINIMRRFEQTGLNWPLPAEVPDSDLEAALFPPRAVPQELNAADQPDLDYLEKELARPHVTLQRLFEEYAEQHPNGLSRSAFYRFVGRRRIRPVSMHIEHKGGDKLYVDYSGDGLEYIRRDTGEIVPVELYACAWGASSYSFAEATESQKGADFTPSHVRAMEYFGVAPHAFVPDNLKSGVKKADRYDPVANPLYAKMAQHYNVAILPARVRKPKDKAVVECAVLQLQRFILARLRNRQFFSLAEVNAAIREELEVFNARPMKDHGGKSRRERFEELDRPHAQALPAEHFKICRIELNVRVAPNYHLRFNDHYYSVPHQFARCKVDIYQMGHILEIYHDNRHICRHLLQPTNYGYTTITEHMPPNHAFVKGWSREWFLHKALEIGTATAEAVKRIMESRQHVQQGFNAALGVLQLAKAYTPLRLERACQRALHFKSVSYRALKTILEQNLDKQLFLPLAGPEQPSKPVVHENLRGPDYYVNP